MQTQLRTKRLVLSSILVALGIGLQIVEAMIIPAANLPGGKLGLANITTVVMLYVFDSKTALACAILRAFLGSVLYGGVSSMIYSVSGAFFSAVMMIVIKHNFGKHLTHIGISVIGAVCHNIAQVSVAVLLLENVWIFTYLPILVIVACITGIFTGYAARYASEYLIKTDVYKK